jgi:hypothetical protein
VLGLLAEKNYTRYVTRQALNPEQLGGSPYETARGSVELARKLLKDAVPYYAM